MQKALLAVGGILWFGLVFLVTWWFTFPSQPIADRLKVEVSQATGGSYELALSEVSPWWTGVSASNVVLYEVKEVRGQDAIEKSPLFAFESARVRASLFSLLRNQPRVIGSVQIGSSDLGFDVTTGMNKKGTQLAPRKVSITADGFPVQDLAGLAGATMEASGGLDLDVELSADESMRDAVGDIKIRGRDILISSIDPEMTGGMDLGMEVPIEQIDIHFEVEDGKATVRTGKIESKLVDTEMEGDITLREDFGRSTLALEFALELGDELEMFKSFLKRAEWDDGSFHYKCTGTFNRPTCREDPQRGSTRSSRPTTPSGTGRTPRATTSGGTDATSSAGSRGRLTPEEREKRRQEALDRLRQNRDRRDGTASDGAETAAGDGEELEEIGYVEGEEEFDEELPPDDLPADEVPLDEPIFDEQ